MPDTPPPAASARPLATVPAGSTATLAVLVRAALGLSHREAKARIAAGVVEVDGDVVVDPVARPGAGASIALRERPAPPARQALAGPGFVVLHLDEALVVVAKEPGIVVIPTEKENPEDPPLVARVLATLNVSGHRMKEGLWVVHRIDRDTSGLVVFARSELASERVREQFRARRAEREYVCWTEGIPPAAEGTLEHLLHDDPKTRRVTVAKSLRPGVREARLDYRVEAQTADPQPRARVRVRLSTGRRNQIRVQFAACGFPILGDLYYGATDPGPERVALHAESLGFMHPMTGATLQFRAAWPRDLLRLDRRLFGYDPRVPQGPPADAPQGPVAPEAPRHRR